MKLTFKDINDKDHNVLFTLETNNIPSISDEICYDNSKEIIAVNVLHICRNYKKDHCDEIKEDGITIFVSILYML